MVSRPRKMERDIGVLREFESIISDNIKCCKEMVPYVLGYGCDKTGELTNLKNAIKGFAEVDKEIEALCNTVSEVQSTLEIAELEKKEEVLGTFLPVFETCLSSEDIKDQYARIITSIEEVIQIRDKGTGMLNVSESDELLVTETTEILKDPLTKKNIEDPVKSRTCGHIFERNTILKFLQTVRKCPYPGCPNVLKKEDLMDDLELKNKLMKIA